MFVRMLECDEKKLAAVSASGGDTEELKDSKRKQAGKLIATKPANLLQLEASLSAYLDDATLLQQGPFDMGKHLVKVEDEVKQKVDSDKKNAETGKPVHFAWLWSFTLAWM